MAPLVPERTDTLGFFRQLHVHIVDHMARFRANLLRAVNQFYSDSLSERVRYRMAEAVKSGRFVWRAPLGYRNVQNNRTKNLARDEERAPQLNSLKSERFTMAQLMQDASQSIMNLAKTWLEADLARRQEIQTALFPDGLRFHPDYLFFEPGSLNRAITL